MFHARLAIGILLSLSLTACAQPKALQYQGLQHFRIQQADLSKATLVADLQFFNPNHHSVSVKSGQLDAYLNGRYLGKAILDEQTLIPSNDTFLLPVKITAALGDIFNNAIDLIAHP